MQPTWSSRRQSVSEPPFSLTWGDSRSPAFVPRSPGARTFAASGALKQLTYGNNLQLGVNYDNRLRVTRWNVANGGSNVLGSEYSYSSPNIPEGTGRVTFARSTVNPTLDRSYSYDHVGRLNFAYSGSEGRAHAGVGEFEGYDGPYAQDYEYDVWSNLTHRGGWGGENPSYDVSFNEKNQRAGSDYDASGNITSDGGQSFSYDATGQQASASYHGLQQFYDGDRLRVKKVENGFTTYYIRSSVLGGQVVADLLGNGDWLHGYVYLGGQQVAYQENGRVLWVHQDPITKSQRLTDTDRVVNSTIELDPWGGEAGGGWSQTSWLRPYKYTTYERDQNGSDDAMHRRYNRQWSRFDQPDPYEGSYDSTDPQSFNRYSYVQNDPVNFVDPSGLQLCTNAWCGWGGGGGFWGGGYSGGTGWGSDPRPGRGIIAETERLFTSAWTGPRYFRTPEGLRINLPLFDFGSAFGGYFQDRARGREATDDCQRFADLVQGIADRTNSDDEFLDELARTFTAANNSSIAEMRRNANNRMPAGRPTFGDSGFKTQFQDGSNQVRHFVAGFIAGARGGLPGLVFMNRREGGHNPSPDNTPDVRLNGVSTNLGSAFTQRPDAVDFRRARLAAQIREDVCQ